MRILKKVFLGLLIFVGLGVLAVVILAFSFNQAMKSDADEEAKIRDSAEQYIIEHFEDEVIVYDVLYDNMDNFSGFEYAAKARHETFGTTFLIYRNEETGQLIDTFINDKWEDDAETSIKPYIEEKLGPALTSQESEPIVDGDNWDEIEEQMKGKLEIFVWFDEQVVEEANVDVNNPISYNEVGVAPSLISITIPRNKQTDDDRIFDELIDSFKTDGIFRHGLLRVEYIDMGVPLEEENWEKSF